MTRLRWAALKVLICFRILENSSCRRISSVSLPKQCRKHDFFRAVRIFVHLLECNATYSLLRDTGQVPGRHLSPGRLVRGCPTIRQILQMRRQSSARLPIPGSLVCGSAILSEAHMHE
ncbi:hypothetical protein BKA63DRAFT_501853 [Paraphoma chrysanthemicola]|nr:hypothetical protein BKA63DRAFT_501853 [Paraphoma chrysanthemicola]